MCDCSNYVPTISNAKPTRMLVEHPLFFATSPSQLSSYHPPESLQMLHHSFPAAPPPHQWREKYSTPGHPETRLRLLFVGHNPSVHAWASGHFYSNPMNHFWTLLRQAQIIPPSFTCENDVDMPHALGIGFTDLGMVPGTPAHRTRVVRPR